MVNWRGILVMLMALNAPGSSAEEVLRLLAEPADRTALALTVYSGDFALVREARRMALPAGRLELEVQGVARTIEPASLAISDNQAAITVLEQSYRFDLLNKSSLLERFIGRKLKYSRTVREENRFEKVLRAGVLLSINPEVVRFGDEIEIDPEGTISLPYLPDDLKTTPTLMWLIDNGAVGERDLEVSYLAGGISWQADYVLTLDQSGDSGQLQGWVTLENQAGVSFSDAEVSLVAGQVNRVRRGAPRPMAEVGGLARMAASAPQVAALGDYQQYYLPRRIDLDTSTSKQVELLWAEMTGISRRYISESDAVTRQYAQPQAASAEVRLKLTAPPSVSLPAGLVRIYQPDSRGLPQLLGEDQVAHVSGGDAFEVRVGKANDIKILRTQSSYRRHDDRSVEFVYDIKVSNRLDKAADIVVSERLQGDWQILRESITGRRQGSNQVYSLKVPAGSDRTLSYAARTTF